MPTYYSLPDILFVVKIRMRTNGKEIYYHVEDIRALMGLTLKNVKITRIEELGKDTFLGTTMTDIIECYQDGLSGAPQHNLVNTLCDALELLAERNFETWLSEQKEVREKAIADGAVVVKEVGSVPEFGIIVYMEQNYSYRTYYDFDKKYFMHNNVLMFTMPKMISVVTDQCVIDVCDNVDFHVSIQNSKINKTWINEINTTVANAVNKIMAKNNSDEVIVIGEAHGEYGNVNPKRIYSMATGTNNKVTVGSL